MKMETHLNFVVSDKLDKEFCHPSKARNVLETY
jgi:hypothetical protein